MDEVGGTGGWDERPGGRAGAWPATPDCPQDADPLRTTGLSAEEGKAVVDSVRHPNKENRRDRPVSRDHGQPPNRP